MYECTYEGNKSCKDYVQLVRTDLGLCCTFNSVKQEYIFRNL